MKKIIALEQKGFLDKGQEVFEWEVAKKTMDEDEIEYFSLWSNTKHYYFKSNYSLTWLSIEKGKVKVEIIDDAAHVSDYLIKTKDFKKTISCKLDDTAQTKPKFKVGDMVVFIDDDEKEVFEIEKVKVEVSILYELKGDKFPPLIECLLVPAPTKQRYFNVYKWLEDTIKRGKDAKYVQEYLDTMMKNHGKLAKDGAQNYPEWCDEK